MAQLHIADYVVFSLLLLISALAGPFYMFRDRKKRETSESYFVGNRALNFIPTAASLFASFWSAIALIGIPAELYTGGAKFFMSILGQVIGIFIGAYFAVPLMYKLKLISTYQYIELRFGSRSVRKLGTVAGVLTSLFSLAVTTYAPCVALEAVSPIPLSVSVISVAAITMIYTVLGGIKAVVLVDLFQAIVMFFGVFVAMIMGFRKIDGGFWQAMELASAGERLNFFDFNADPRNTYSFWAMVVPQILFSAGIYATSQAAVQRYSALPSVKQATWSILLMMPQILIFKVMLFLLSLAMFAYYDIRGCDPLRGKLISNPNQLTTFFVVDVLDHYPGLVGLWFAALFSGSLSTMSTGYNSVAAIIWEDFLKEKYERRLSTRRISAVFKFITLMLGVSSCLLAFVFKYLSGSIIKLTMSTVSVFGAAVFIAYLGGALFPFVNGRGTVCGMISSTIFTGFLAGGQLFYRLGNEQVWLPTKTNNCSAYYVTTTETATLASSYSLVNIISAPFSNNTQNLLWLTSSSNSNHSIFPPSNSDPSVVALKLWWKDADNLPSTLLYMFSISYFLFPFFSVLAGILVAIAFSLMTGGIKSARYVDKRYLMVRNCFALSSSRTADDDIEGGNSSNSNSEAQKDNFKNEIIASMIPMHVFKTLPGTNASPPPSLTPPELVKQHYLTTFQSSPLNKTRDDCLDATDSSSE